MTTPRALTAALLQPELDFTTSRSSGPGGQNVNKVNTKVTLKFDVGRSLILTPEEKELILTKLHSKITTDGVLVVVAQTKRSQLANKEEALTKLEQMLAKAFEKKKTRKRTKPSKAAVKKRIDSKKLHAEKKQSRKKLF